MGSVISMIPYANMAPYRMLGPVPGCEFQELVPSASVKALKENQVVAAAVPVGALPMLEGIVAPVGAFGIAASKAVGSVLLFSNGPLSTLVRPKEIHLTSQSATSIRLLYLILGYANGFVNLPYVTRDRKRAAADLLIGDDALCRAKENPTPHVIDLVTEWHRAHQKPFVFARWVVRKDAPTKVKEAIEEWLNGLKQNDAAFVEESAAIEAKRIGVSKDEMVTYLKGMTRVLGKEELEGQLIFLDELERRVPKGLFERKPVTSKSPKSPFSKGTAAFSPFEKGRGDFQKSNTTASTDAAIPHHRIDHDTCIRLLSDAPLGEVMAAAHDARMTKHPEMQVTYVRDTNPNYTNICRTKCTFCAFCKSANDEGAYTLTPSALADKVKLAEDKGAATVLLQGGHNPDITLKDWIAYIEGIRAVSPSIHVHPFSPPEILFMADQEGQSTIDILKALKHAGITTVPGGGAEILSNEIRRAIAPKKYSADEWLRVMEEAHTLRFKTTATMMFGHLENDAHIAEHLFRLRELQDRTGGFSSFIPWSFKPGSSPLTDKVPTMAHPARYVRIIAVARLVLDNFDHIQSSWFSESERAGMLGLVAGADDFGGILVEENVLRKTGYKKQTTEERVRQLIREAGFTPALRDSNYRVIETFDLQKTP